MEQSLLEYFDHRYLDVEVDHTHGSKLIAALGHQFPRFSRAGRTRLMPSALRALQAWQRLHPSGTRMPLPMPALSGVAMLMAQQGDLMHARLTMIAADCYLRPGEAVHLSFENVMEGQPGLGPAYAKTALLLHPSAGMRASKVGLFDDSIVCDSVDRTHMGPLLLLLKKAAQSGSPLINTTLSNWGAALKLHGQRLGIAHLHPYVLRHSGPSDDHLRKRRSLDEIRKRGRWAQESSAKRYTKAARTLAQMQDWSAEVKRFMREADEHIGSVLLGVRRPLSWSPVQLHEQPAAQCRRL